MISGSSGANSASSQFSNPLFSSSQANANAFANQVNNPNPNGFNNNNNFGNPFQNNFQRNPFGGNGFGRRGHHGRSGKEIEN